PDPRATSIDRAAAHRLPRGLLLKGAQGRWPDSRQPFYGRAMNRSERFAPLRRAARVWAIAAIHGEAQRLASIHAALSPRFGAGDRLVYLGNYLGRGSDIVATIDELLRFRREIIARPGTFAYDLVYLRGSQEEMWQKLQQLQFAINPREVLDWMMS